MWLLQGKEQQDDRTKAGAIKVKKNRLARQYMNRRGGFNRPLPAERTGEKVGSDVIRLSFASHEQWLTSAMALIALRRSAHHNDHLNRYTWGYGHARVYACMCDGAGEPGSSPRGGGGGGVLVPLLQRCHDFFT